MSKQGVNQGVVFPPLPLKRYAVLYADPPWDYQGQRQHSGAGGRETGGAVVHYPTVKLKDLKRLDVSSACEPDCLMFMWSSSPHLDQAIELLKAWGFKWSTVAFVWHKGKTNPGFYTLSQCELCLLGKRGKIPQPRGSRKVRQFVYSLRGEHSVKPGQVRRRITAMFPEQAKLEMFARGRADGWDSWGV